MNRWPDLGEVVQIVQGNDRKDSFSEEQDDVPQNQLDQGFMLYLFRGEAACLLATLQKRIDGCDVIFRMLRIHIMSAPRKSQIPLRKTHDIAHLTHIAVAKNHIKSRAGVVWSRNNHNGRICQECLGIRIKNDRPFSWRYTYLGSYLIENFSFPFYNLAAYTCTVTTSK